jgi:hypothetical protein
MQPFFRVPILGDSLHYLALHTRTNQALCTFLASLTSGANLKLVYWICIKPYFLLTGHTYDWACVQ